jgi:ribosomal protein S27E
VQIVCPNCGEEYDLSFDPSEGHAQFVVDCEICCRPMTVTTRVHDGEIEIVDVTPA